jgi:quercetin dioxygenase-like cupin family protein
MFVFKDKVEEVEFGKGIKMRVLGTGTRMNAMHWSTIAGIESPEHQHPEEQFGYILKGEFEITAGEEKVVLGAGDSYFIPANIPHKFRIIGDSEAIDIFSPQREIPKPES